MKKTIDQPLNCADQEIAEDVTNQLEYVLPRNHLPDFKFTHTEIKRIPVLRHSKLVAYAFVSAQDYERTMIWSWNLIIIKNKNRFNFYAQGYVNGKNIRLHAFIYGPVKKGCVVDHYNSFGLDNTQGNLREATLSQNGNNRAKLSGTSSQYIGVCWNKKSRKWQAACAKKLLGYFDDEIIAGISYDRCAIKTFGINAMTNGLLSHEEKPVTLETPVFPSPVRKLPKNISLLPNGRYRIELKRGPKRYIFGGYRTLQAAEEALAIKKKEIDDEIDGAHLLLEIKRNSEGIAILFCHDKDSNVTGEVMVDDSDWHVLSKIRWNITRDGYVQGTVNYSTIRLHNYLLGGSGVDRIDHNPKNNRRSNLRFISASGQSQNRRKRTGFTSKYLGVSMSRSQKRWTASMSLITNLYSGLAS